MSDKVLDTLAQESEFYKAMQANQEFEQMCYDKARRELEGQCNTGIEFVLAVIRRAQRIKENIKHGNEAA